MNSLEANNPSAPISFPSGSDSQLIRSTILPGALGPSPRPAGTGSLGAPSLTALLQGLRRRWLLAFAVASLAAGLGVLAVLLMLPIRYTATAAVQISSKKDGHVFATGGAEEVDFTIFKASEAVRIKSPLILKAALDSPRVQELGIVQNNGNASKWLETALKTDFLLGPEVLRVTLSGDDPQEVTVLLNAVVDAFLNELKQADKERLQAKINALDENRANTDNLLRQKKVLLRKILTENKLPDLETLKLEFQNAQQRLNIFKKEQLTAQIELVQAQEELKGLQDKETRLPNVKIEEYYFGQEFERLPEDKFYAEKIFLVQGEIGHLKLLPPGNNRKALLQAKTDDLDTLYADRKKMHEAARPDIEQRLRDRVFSALRGEISKTQEKIAAANKKLELYDSATKGAEDEVRRLDPARRQWPPYVEALNDEIIGLTLTLNKMREVIELFKANGQPPPRAREWFRAETPAGPDMSRQIKFGGAAALGLFGLTLFGFGFLEFRTGRISGAEEVSRGLGMRVLGTLPPVPAHARQGVLSAGDESQGESLWQNRLTEAVDSIRTALMHAARTENVHVIMVTSAGGGEGKTSLATQLAASLARAWRNTLLIDGDLRHPATHKLFELPLEPGFSEVLRGEATPADAVKPTALSRLWLMPAGHWDHHAVQALTQDNVKSIFTGLRQQYEFIIVDSCPVLPVADALSLGQNVDGIVYAVLRDVSRFPALQAAQQRMASLNIRTLGAVLIGANHDSGENGYQYAMSQEKK